MAGLGAAVSYMYVHTIDLFSQKQTTLVFLSTYLGVRHVGLFYRTLQVFNYNETFLSIKKISDGHLTFS